MPKITFTGAGSTVFAKRVLCDCMLVPALKDSHIALYDIDATRLRESRQVLDIMNDSINDGRAKITSHLGVSRRKQALKGADYVVNAIQVGGYDPATIADFEVPKKYGLRQTIADTIGIGGIFRALRTIPVMMDFAEDMEEVCPDALLLNYSNPMAILTGAVLRQSDIRCVGLCHSVQACASSLLKAVGMYEGVEKLQWKIAGINHQAWLLEISDDGKDLYPEIKKKATRLLDKILRAGGPEAYRRKRLKTLSKEEWEASSEKKVCNDMVRLKLMLEFGYYVTESSEHCAEYMPYWIKATHPELIEQYGIPLDEYPRRCVRQIDGWARRIKELKETTEIGHDRSHEYGSRIIEAAETDVPFTMGGNVINTGLIDNLPSNACVEVPCMVDRSGVQACHVGRLPEQCAALNRTNINCQLLTIEAARTLKKDHIYQAAMLDPHTSAELPIDSIKNMCDDLIEAHGNFLPPYN
jgi:alpha-galactosidase